MAEVGEIKIDNEAPLLSSKNEERIQSLKKQLALIRETAIQHRTRAARRTKHASVLRTSIHILDVLSLCSLAVQFGQREDTREATLYVTSVFATVSAVFSAMLTSLQLDFKSSADRVNSRVLFNIFSWFENRILVNNLKPEDYQHMYNEITNRMTQYREGPEAIL